MGFKEKADKLANKFPSQSNTEFYPSGSAIFDAVLGGGIPKGVYIEIASKSGLGKSTAVLHFCKTICNQGKKAVYLDFEQGVNQSQLEGIGLSEHLGENFFLFQPVTFADGEEIIDNLAKEDELAYIVIDSVTAMLPSELQDLSVKDVRPGLHARLSSTFLKKYKSLARKRNITFLFVNQMRYKLNFRGRSSEKPAGGNAQKFYTDIRLQMSKKEELERVQDTIEGEKKVSYGVHVGVWASKNRYERPNIEAVATIIYGKGISNLTAFYRWMIKRGKVKRKGSWYEIWLGSDGDEPIEKVQGKEALKQWVKDNKDYVSDYIQENGGFLLIGKEKDGADN